MDDLSVVVRTSDPARLAELARALGLTVENPNRPNPDAWTSRLNLSSVITAVGDATTGLNIGVRDHELTLERLVTLLGQPAVIEDVEGGRCIAGGPDGLRLVVDRNAPWCQTHDVWDVGLLCYVMPTFEQHRDRIANVLRDVGATNPRLAGPNLARLSGKARWWLVVDGPDDVDLTPARALLQELRGRKQAVEVRRSTEIDPELLARIDNQAFDI